METSSIGFSSKPSDQAKAAWTLTGKQLNPPLHGSLTENHFKYPLWGNLLRCRTGLITASTIACVCPVKGRRHRHRSEILSFTQFKCIVSTTERHCVRTSRASKATLSEVALKLHSLITSTIRQPLQHICAFMK